MPRPPPETLVPQIEVKPAASDHFAWMRTRLALERTLLAWVRTSISLIGFGFTIVQFFERVKDFDGALPARMPEAPRYLGLTLIALGTVTLVIAWIEYRQTIAYLRSEAFAGIAAREDMAVASPLYLVVIALSLIGGFCFLAISFRVM